MLAFTASDPGAPSELFVCGADGGGERRLTDFNRAWTREVAPRAPGAVPLRARRLHGRRLDHEAPPASSRAAAIPLLLNVHGGPHAQYGYTFFDEFQV